MVAAAVLLDGGLALGALLGVGVDPVGRLGVVVALLDPLADERALDRVVPVLAAREAEHVAALALDRPRVHVAHARRVVAVGRRAPAHQAVALWRENKFQLISWVPVIREGGRTAQVGRVSLPLFLISWQ